MRRPSGLYDVLLYLFGKHFDGAEHFAVFEHFHKVYTGIAECYLRRLTGYGVEHLVGYEHTGGIVYLHVVCAV